MAFLSKKVKRACTIDRDPRVFIHFSIINTEHDIKLHFFLYPKVFLHIPRVNIYFVLICFSRNSSFRLSSQLLVCLDLTEETGLFGKFCKVGYLQIEWLFAYEVSISKVFWNRHQFFEQTCKRKIMTSFQFGLILMSKTENDISLAQF